LTAGIPGATNEEEKTGEAGRVWMVFMGYKYLKIGEL
jgi:hypothetical protein